MSSSCPLAVAGRFPHGRCKVKLQFNKFGSPSGRYLVFVLFRVGSEAKDRSLPGNDVIQDQFCQCASYGTVLRAGVKIIVVISITDAFIVNLDNGLSEANIEPFVKKLRFVQALSVPG